jgi:hypothetical protein
VGELWTGDELDVEKRLVPQNRPVDHREQCAGMPGDRFAMARSVGSRLAGRAVIARDLACEGLISLTPRSLNTRGQRRPGPCLEKSEGGPRAVRGSG